MAPELFCGRAPQPFVSSILSPGATSARLGELTTPIKSSARPPVPPATVRWFGRKTEVSAILGLCQEILQVRESQLTTPVMLLDSRRVQRVGARFSGLKRLECRISEYSPVEIRAALPV